MLGFLKKLFGVGKKDLPKRTASMDEIDALRVFVELICSRLVDFPEKVKVEVKRKDRLTILQVSCEKEDVGKIVGKSGKTIAAIRSLVNGASGRSGVRASVEVLD